MVEEAVARFKKLDRDGNSYLVEPCPEDAEKSDLYIRIGANPPWRYIGKLSMKLGRVSLLVKKTRGDIFRARNAFGLCHHVVAWLASEAGTIEVRFEGKGSILPASAVLSAGGVLWFKGRGFERQVFTGLEAWGLK